MSNPNPKPPMRADLPPQRPNDPTHPFFPPYPYQDDWHASKSDPYLAEVHLYDGSLCNRACSFCCVGGHPQGWQRNFQPQALQLAVSLVAPNGRIKFYGGEPTIHVQNILFSVQTLHELGFHGSFLLFTNGLLPQRLLELLNRVPSMSAVLNYSILHGRGAPPIPTRSLHMLLESPHSTRIFSGHPEVSDAGIPHHTPDPTTEHPAPTPTSSSCPHCYPVIRSDGIVHGCPFAVEILKPHFHLGHTHTDPKTVLRRFHDHIHWQKETLEPAAKHLNSTPCNTCTHHLDHIPTPTWTAHE